MLEIRNLKKTYPGKLHALSGLDLTLAPGMFGLLGPNGAGKSTLMRILAGQQLPDTGTVCFAGIDILTDPFAMRRRLGYLPQSFGAYPYIGCRALLRHMAVLKGLPDDARTARQVDDLIELTNLAAHAARPVSKFSGGMRQRFGIAQALLGNPDLLVLDEPTAGLDPQERSRLYNVLSQLSADRIVLLSTHIVDDVEQLCSEAAIIHSGRILASSSTDALVGELAGTIWEGTRTIEPAPGPPVTGDPAASAAMLLNSAYRRGTPVHRYRCKTRPAPDFVPVAPTLEDRYFAELRRAEGAPC